MVFILPPEVSFLQTIVSQQRQKSTQKVHSQISHSRTGCGLIHISLKLFKLLRVLEYISFHKESVAVTQGTSLM